MVFLEDYLEKRMGENILHGL